MKIREIKIQNYRSHKELRLEFGGETTVFIGKNGAGKSNLLSAVRQSMNFILFRKEGNVQYDFFKGLSQGMKRFVPADARYVVTRNQVEYTYPVKINAVFDTSVDGPFVGEAPMIDLVMQKETASALMTGNVVYESERVWNFLMSNRLPLPVIASYSDAFPHVTAKIPPAISDMLKTSRGLPRCYGYYKWDEIIDCTPLWNNLLFMGFSKGLISTAYSNRFISAVKACLINFASPLAICIPNEEFELRDISMSTYDGREAHIIFKFANGTEMTFDTLPAGYRRLFSMVLDIACRSYLLNDNCDSDGIVLIDEIDLHLHPAMAQEVVARFSRTFPNIQFIITTHSPLVLSSVRPNESNMVYQLTANHDAEANIQQIMNPYGLDATAIIQMVMGASPRNQSISDRLERLFGFIDDNNLTQAEEALTQLRLENDQIPELTQAQTMIDLTRNLDEED